MKQGNILYPLYAALLLLLFSLPALAGPAEPQPIQKDDRCPVCGMFVAKYRTWVAQIVFADGTHAAFDGPKDMFKYFLNPSKYTPNRTTADIAGLYVTEYYSAKPVDAKKLFYVFGSDVLGPMGDELIPLASQEKAREFMADHRGKGILTFPEVTLDRIEHLHER